MLPEEAVEGKRRSLFLKEVIAVSSAVHII
jgi:hypothetical protein